VKRFVQSWLINTFAVLMAVYLVPGIHYDRPVYLLAASLLLGVLNAVLRPVLMLLALPLLIVTLGLFTLVINALLLYLVGLLLQPHFSVGSFGAAILGALIIGIISLVLNTLTGAGHSRIHFERRKHPPRDGGDGGGPVIDV
jgi:putative membrane protein